MVPDSNSPPLTAWGCRFATLFAGAYGSTKRYKSFDRLRKVGD